MPDSTPLRRTLDNLRGVLRFAPLDADVVGRRLRRSASVADLRSIARRRVPRGVFDYVDGGAEDERSLRHNTEAFRSITFRPRVLRDVSSIDPSTTLLGRRLPVPLVLSPTGFTRILHSEGELAVARAAGRAGLPYALSTLGTRSIEEVAAAGDGPKWFQVYVWRDRGLVRDLIERARDAHYEAIVLTVDTAAFGKRERDVRRGFTLPPTVGPGTLLDGALHPTWTWDFVRADPIRFANVMGRDVGDGASPVSLHDYTNSQFDPSTTWTDLEWLRDVWAGPLVVKGIQTVADARIAATAGVQALMLSNHGGRQLDTAPAPIDLVAPVRDAIGDGVQIICDGGVRRGSDVVKAVARGADAAAIGRAYLYGLGAAGERGVDHVLGLLADEVRRTMALCGADTVAGITADLVSAPT
ncbi:MAG: alpha-hydroxy acid oxidase [Actinomycetes bacterium]